MIKRKSIIGFTLIELLIVVAIIAILAAIAIPNFLAAQVRSKVSRTIAEMRTITTALEAYASDANRYPIYGNPLDYIDGTSLQTFIPVHLTTPVAYITSLPNDPFPGSRNNPLSPTHSPFYYYHNYNETYLSVSRHAGHVEEHYFNLMGENRAVEYEMWSYGPNLTDQHGTTMYDPTNGTVSNGDLERFGP